jgi:hypothetical protein
LQGEKEPTNILSIMMAVATSLIPAAETSFVVFFGGFAAKKYKESLGRRSRPNPTRTDFATAMLSIYACLTNNCSPAIIHL